MACVTYQSVEVGLSKDAQADSSTAATTFFKMSHRELGVPVARRRTEDDAGFLGKGHPFATTSYKSNLALESFPLRNVLNAPLLVVAAKYGYGKFVSKTGVGPYVYTFIPQMEDGSDCEAKFMTAVFKAPADGSVHDSASIGLYCSEFEVEVVRGAGIDNSSLRMEFAGLGNETDPSGISLPATTLKPPFLGQGSVAAVINGVDYVALKKLEEIRWGIRNTFRDDGVRAGSGEVDGFAVGNRMIIQTQEVFLSFLVLMDAASDELAKIKNQTEGTAVITQTGGADTYTLTMHRINFKTVDLENADGLLTVRVEARAFFDETGGPDGVADLVITTAEDGFDV